MKRALSGMVADTLALVRGRMQKMFLIVAATTPAATEFQYSY